MKYIVYQWYGTELPIVFPECVSHNTFKDLSPISAGFWKITSLEGKPTGVEVFGESNTLKLKSRQEDADIIEHLLQNAGCPIPLHKSDGLWLEEMLKQNGDQK
jgi:hypothetical protein